MTAELERRIWRTCRFNYGYWWEVWVIDKKSLRCICK